MRSLEEPKNFFGYVRNKFSLIFIFCNFNTLDYQRRAISLEDICNSESIFTARVACFPIFSSVANHTRQGTNILAHP